MTPEPIRVGIIGAGGIAQHYHAPSYRRCENVALVAACDINEATLKQMQEAHGVQRVYSDYRAMLDKESLDLVSVCTSNDMHHPVVMEAIERGLSIYCEKPLALTYQQAVEMYEAAEAKGLRTGVNFSHRRTPAAQLAKEIIDSGALGAIHYVSAIYAAGNATYGTGPATWRNDQAKAGFGGLGDMGSHVMDMMRWWLGTDIVGVAAQMATYFPDRTTRDGQPFTVTTEDQGMLLVRYANNAMGYFYGGYIFTGRGYDQRVEVYGSQGGLIYDQQRSHELQVFLPKEYLERYVVAREGGTRDTPYTTILVPERHEGRVPGQPPSVRRTVLMDFVEAYRCEGPFTFSPSFYEGMKVQEVLEATRRADQAFCWVSLPL